VHACIDIIMGARTCLKKHVIRNIAVAAYHVSKAGREQLVEMLRKYRYNTLLTAHGYVYATACPIMSSLIDDKNTEYNNVNLGFRELVPH